MIILMRVVTLVVVCSIATVAILILIALIVFAQWHRATKRKQMEGLLIRDTEMVDLCVCS